MKTWIQAAFGMALLLLGSNAFCQKEPARIVAGIPVNYNEDSVGNYSLPNLLQLKNGKKVSSAAVWTKKRRPEILKLYQSYQFGKIPGKPANLRFEVFDNGTLSFNGKAIRKQITVYFSNDTLHKMDLLVYLPANLTKPAPLLLHISFTANSTTINDSGIKPGIIWTKEGKHLPAPAAGTGRLNIEPFLDQGFGVATVYYGDIEPDFPRGFQYGIRGSYKTDTTASFQPDDWGAIASWAWGLSRAMDYFETDPQIDAKRIALFGVSRLGKTVLCAGAYDTRFAMVIANCSGEGGAALSRRNYGETIKLLSLDSRYAYQLCKNYQLYGDSVQSFPVDGHMLVSLMAPRPLLLQTGDVDYWSDPKGEFLAAQAATVVYKLFGKSGIGPFENYVTGKPIVNTLGFSMHSGGHGTVPVDWDIALDFMKKHL